MICTGVDTGAVSVCAGEAGGGLRRRLCVIDTGYYHLYTFILIIFALFIGRLECEVRNRTWNLERYLRSGL